MASREMSSGVDIELPSDPASVGEARRAVTELARKFGAQEGDVGLAVSEAVGNAIVHAFRGREPGTIRVTARAINRVLTVTVADDGIGMSPNLNSTGLGFGISLITKVAFDVRFESSDGGTRVTMDFPAARA